MGNRNFSIAGWTVLLPQKTKAPAQDAASHTPIFRIAIWKGQLCHVSEVYFWIALCSLQRIGRFRGLDKNFPQVASGFPSRSFPSPAHSLFGLLDHDPIGGKFSPDRIRSGKLFGRTGRIHLCNFLVDLLVRERVGTQSVQ